MATIIVEVPTTDGKGVVRTRYSYQRLNKSTFKMSMDKIGKSNIEAFAFAYDSTFGSSICFNNSDGTLDLYSTRAETYGAELTPGDHKFAMYLRSLHQLGVISGKAFRHNMRQHERQMRQNNIDADLHTINEAIAAAGITLNKTQAARLATYAAKARAKE